jgi:predicted DNA-binding transcriptional regulator YafY
MIPPSIQKNELLSLYALKSYLKEFKGTNIESHLVSIKDKLENIAPGEVYTELEGKDDFIWDQNFGSFDYSQFDDLLEEIIQNIIDKSWIKITYEGSSSTNQKTYSVFPYCLFNYHGTLYLVTYVPSYKNTISLVIQKIKSIERIENRKDSTPVFNMDQFRNERFGVFGGEPQKVRLQINRAYVS